MPGKKYRALVIGTSAGGFDALSKLFSSLEKGLGLAYLVVIHRNSSSQPFLADYLNKNSKLQIKEAEDKEVIKEDFVYIAPPDYHMLINRNKTITLTVSPPINYSRPSVDALFETASEVYFESLIGLILTGANNDGSKGIKCLKELGGHTIIQDFDDAEVDIMPRSAYKSLEGEVDRVINIVELSKYLKDIIKD